MLLGKEYLAITSIMQPTGMNCEARKNEAYSGIASILLSVVLV